MKRLASLVILATIVGMMIACAVAFAHATTQTHSIQSAALGINEPYTNPNTYLLASVADGEVIKNDKDQYFTRVKFQPYGTYALYTQTVLFCGDAADQFNGKSGPLIVTYEISGHRVYQGEACHILIGVFEVKGQEQ